MTCQRPRVMVVIPTYNERENLASLVLRVLGLGAEYNVIIVDDGSPDGTGLVADQLAVQHGGRVHVVHRPSKEGIGPAYVSGFKSAIASKAAFIAQMDADHSHHPEELPRLVAAATSHDLVIGSRYVPGGRTMGWSLWRRVLSRFGNLYVRAVLRVPIVDLTGGFKVFQREVLAGLDLDTVQANGYAFQIETTYRVHMSGKRVVELPIIFTERVAGDSKLSHHIMLEAIRAVWRLRLQKTVPHQEGGISDGAGFHGRITKHR